MPDCRTMSSSLCVQTVAALMPYLLHLRSRLPRQQPPSSAAPLTSADFAVVVDTMLLRTYLKVGTRRRGLYMSWTRG